MARYPKTAAGYIEQQSGRVLQTAWSKVDRIAGQAMKAVNDRNRRKYVLAGLAALVAAGRVAEQAYSRLRSTPAGESGGGSPRRKAARRKKAGRKVARKAMNRRNASRKKRR
ncbi:MAG: hypothetical protein JO245_03610 [Pseudolabrys sp.]|nr:hypothetical protein [Pseudolabrys sp.]